MHIKINWPSHARACSRPAGALYQVVGLLAGLGLSFCLLTGISHAQQLPQILPLETYTNHILDSGGVLLAEQNAYDVYFYDIDLKVDIEDQRIQGTSITHATITKPLTRFVWHLDSVFTVENVVWILPEEPSSILQFEHEQGLLIADLHRQLNPGENIALAVSWAGSPRKAPNPPWEGGFTWTTTPDGEPWVAVSCQLNGADIWWPVKDHPSDRPDSVSVRITVPEHLTALSNGALRSSNSYSDNTRTFHWVNNSAINPYAVTINIAPYVAVEQSYTSITGTTMPVSIWAIPGNEDKAQKLMVQVVEHLRFFEELLGPYPFQHQKYGVAEAPFLGMEHQTLIAYGAGYENDTVFRTDSGFDDLHHHELAHEWWGNLVAVSDWKDFWIHEGFATYMQAMYAESLGGANYYDRFMRALHARISNNMPVAPHTTKSSRDMYSGRDVYMKGAWILHTLRRLIGDEPFIASMQLMLYPDDSWYPQNGLPGRGRLVDTNDYIRIVENITDLDLAWFFDAYLRYAELPELEVRLEGNRLWLTWNTPSEHPFLMPVTIADGDRLKRVVPGEGIYVEVEHPDRIMIDPEYSVLRKNLYSGSPSMQ